MVNQQRGPVSRSGHTNYTTMEIPMGQEVRVGTFFLNERPIIILFVSGASHDFMSSTCAKKMKLTLVALGAPYIISKPDGQVDADWILWKVPLDLAGLVFETDLIILSGQGIDVIHVHLNSLVYGKITLHLPMISRIKPSLHHVVERKIEEIHVVWEFLNMFPDDLPGMPPERAIEFKIELQPGTAPISKSLYQMTPMELVELKIQPKICLTMVISAQAHHLRVV
jgi:hypothetical protein